MSTTKSFTISEGKCVSYKAGDGYIDKLRFETTNGNVVHVTKSQLDHYLNTDTSMLTPPDWDGIQMEVTFYDPGEVTPQGYKVPEEHRNKIHKPFGFKIIKNNAYEGFAKTLLNLRLAGMTFKSHANSDPYVEKNQPTIDTNVIATPATTSLPVSPTDDLPF